MHSFLGYFLALVLGFVPVVIDRAVQPAIPKSDTPAKGDKAAPLAKKRNIRIPDAIPAPAPKPEPAPVPKPDPQAAVSLGKGQFYVIASDVPLVVNVNAGLALNGAGDVTVQLRKPPLMLPAELAVGHKPDAADPEFIVFSEAYLYIVKAKVVEQPNKIQAGPVILQIIPAVNDVDAEGKAIPLTAADITYRPVSVVSGEAPRPPPKPDPIPPPKPKPDPEPDVPADPELVKKLQTAIQADADAMGEAIPKSTIAALGGVYAKAVTAVNFPDPAARPKTFKEVQQQMVSDSREAKVPAPPSLANLRKAIEADALPGGLAINQPIDSATAAKLTKAFTRIALALNEIGK